MLDQSLYIVEYNSADERETPPSIDRPNYGRVPEPGHAAATMKVCHLIDHMGLGGAQSMVADLVESRGTGVEGSIVSLGGGIDPDLEKRLKRCGASYLPLHLSKLNPFGAVTLRNALGRERCDLVHAHLDYSNTIGVAAALSFWRRRPQLVSHIHNDPWRQNSAYFRAAASLIAPKVDVHVVPSNAVVNPTQTALRGRCRRVECIGPGIDLERFEPASQDASAVRDFRAGAKYVIGFVGRLVAQKRIDRLLKIVPELVNAEPATRIAIVGDGPLRGFLESECRRLRIDDVVTFTGYMHDTAIAFAAMDVFVLVSSYESFGIVVAEAMASGAPVVATDIPGVNEIVRHGETGLLVDPGETSALATGILQLLRDQALRETLRGAAQDTARREFSRETMTRRVEALYESL